MQDINMTNDQLVGAITNQFAIIADAMVTADDLKNLATKKELLALSRDVKAIRRLMASQAD